MDYGRIIKEYIDERGIAQAFLCRKIGMKQGKMSLLLNGKRKVSLEDFIAICDALNVSLDTFRKST